ncbi:MAG: monofunctional biosynthetic peptidoglycan transglycosylase [Candidatus Cloacimonetes bacterium]|jgi:monofunctional biosynthetic peptidoglycan transglycosylase|nr:monofunctional biosynthetic peptidoglycan transglycosylase [Candidatus Cloacimonadota bacterium]MDY0299529.1 monofunctional biosynthetic peptidoglycan transglycosylase [Candidatus Cloacimonadaceae bacterium]MCB5278810.1 monofunctional biosynthetic peptidoglycan transglycosylase [Candidatus Cloacimonadota bacterium]MCK9332659.1 monofunctional biosynthetic peptidoglycan transglycosylase [Candidatus Cloacimonadota bacterium]MDD2210203.1 monofunctional biosynthetic peptidoglycan transglycosylase
MAKVKKHKRSILSKILRLFFKIHLWFWGIIAALSILFNFINPPVTPLMIERYIFRGHPIYKREYIKLEKIPQRTHDMLIALEDGNYYKHFGFEWNMIKEAYKRNKKAHEVRFGASTISNQLARTIFLTTHRNYFRKYLEVQVTLIMELTMSKRRMLELYFNYVEWGKGVYGIETASRAYYSKSAAKLNTTQSMRMIAILSNPIKYTPHTYANSASARERMRFLQRYF